MAQPSTGPSENELVAVRRRKAADLAAEGTPPYPDADRLRPSIRSAELIERYRGLPADALERETGPEHTHVVAGRIVAVRAFGKAAFLVLRDDAGEVQAYVRKDRVGEAAFALYQKLDVGDFAGVRGTPMRTKTGEFALAADALALLAKTVRPLPEKWHGLTDKEQRYRQRYVDLIANPEVANVFRQRSRIVRHIRNFLDGRGFLEVETPMMHPLAGGAAARPFVTHHNALGLELYLRIAPELYLKRLVVGGLDRVYEINRNFRNEGLSLQHNPEFTMLEFYVAYQTYRDLIDLTEEMIHGLVVDLHGKAAIDYHPDPNDRDKALHLDFTRPWRRVTVHDAVAEALAIPRARLESVGDALAVYHQTFGESEEARARLDALFARHGVKRTLGRGAEIVPETIDRLLAGHLVYALFEEVVEPRLVQPTFVTDFPIAVSPLARRNDSDPTLADRFELFIAGREIANAFSELNDPADQQARFESQMEAKKGGDEEAMPYDADYVRALEYGLPPTAGEGIGIDRLAMLLTDQASIREVILFPLMRPER